MIDSSSVEAINIDVGRGDKKSVKEPMSAQPKLDMANLIP